jgi:DNA polymerase III delta prime subunit
MSEENTNHGRDQNIFNQPGSVIFNTPGERKQDSDLPKLLKVVQREVESCLAQSLHQSVDTLINLDKVLQPHQISFHLGMEGTVQQKRQVQLQENTIAQVFTQKEVDRRLLILGEPGSGKTTTLLALAEDLVNQALRDPSKPIPVLFNLSSWKNPKQSIVKWLIAELWSKYGINKPLGRKWLTNNQLIPLLDGLDEVAPGQQKNCADAINDWITKDVTQQPIGLVVCCRLEEYKEAVQERLFLNNAVVLQPLSKVQVETYLSQFKLDEVWENIHNSKSLQELLRTPLFLSIFGIIAENHKFDIKKWQSMTIDSERWEYLLDRYLDVAMERKLVNNQKQKSGQLSKTYGRKPLPSRKKVLKTLIFAAKSMQKESSTELLIEKIQPTWLTNKRHCWAYQTIINFFTWIICGLLGGLIGSLVLSNFLGALIGTLLISVGFIYPNTRTAESIEVIETIEPIQVSILKFFQRDTLSALKGGLLIGLILGLFLGLFYGLFGWLSFRALSEEIGRSMSTLLFARKFIFKLDFYHFFEFFYRNLIDRLTYGIIFGPIYGLIGGLILGLYASIKSDKITCIMPNQGIKNSCQNMLIFAIFSLGVGFIFNCILRNFFSDILPSKVIDALVFMPTLIFVLVNFFVWGGQAAIQHVSLRIVLAWNGYAPYRYDKLLDYCTERRLLQHIGGRYRFMHKLLQEHFAKMPLD